MRCRLAVINISLICFIMRDNYKLRSKLYGYKIMLYIMVASFVVFGV